MSRKVGKIWMSKYIICPDCSMGKEERIEKIFLNLEEWMRSDEMMSLVKLFGGNVQELKKEKYLGRYIKKLKDFSKVWDMRNGGSIERMYLENSKFVSENEAEIMKNIRELGFIGKTKLDDCKTPINYILPLGGARYTCLHRPQMSKKLIEKYSRDTVMESIHVEMDKLRKYIGQCEDEEKAKTQIGLLVPHIEMTVTDMHTPNMRKVINATGTVLHTNLGRAPISQKHMEHVAEIATGYSNLEYNLEAGRRGERYSHFEKLLCKYFTFFYIPKYASIPFAIPCIMLFCMVASCIARSSSALLIYPSSTIVTGTLLQLIPVIISLVLAPRLRNPVAAA